MDIIISTNQHEVMQIDDDSAWLLCAKLLLEPAFTDNPGFVKLAQYLDVANKGENPLGHFVKDIAPIVNLPGGEILKVFTTQYCLADTQKLIENMAVLKDTGYVCKALSVGVNIEKQKAFERIEKHINDNDPVAVRFAALSGSQKDKVGNVIWVSPKTQEHPAGLTSRNFDYKLMSLMYYELKEICYIKKI